MKKASLVVSKPYQNNRIFDPKDSSLNRDNCLAPFHYLKTELMKKGVNLSTQDVTPLEEADYIIYNDMPHDLPKLSWKERSHLLILESPLVVKNSWDESRLKFFNKVFSWNDDVIDGEKFIKVNYSFEFPKQIKVEGKRKGFCCLISAHKSSNEENELYSERLKAIRWFEKNAPHKFDLFGIGWDRPAHGGTYGRILNKLFRTIPILLKVYPFKKFPSYKGLVSSKKEVMENYKFSICYENIHGLKGYITEKIFDCFFAGCIPIYWGAVNIHHYIPENCFVDRRNFKNYEELDNYLSSLSEEECLEYRQNIQHFLSSEKARVFEVGEFAKIVAHSIVG